jgi:hypothetical protein
MKEVYYLSLLTTLEAILRSETQALEFSHSIESVLEFCNRNSSASKVSFSSRDPWSVVLKNESCVTSLRSGRYLFILPCVVCEVYVPGAYFE